MTSCAPTVASIHDDYVREKARLDPQWATAVGIHDYDGRATRHDDASHEARRILVRKTLARIEAMRPSEAERVDHRLFRAQLEVEEFDARRRDYRTVNPWIPIDAVSSVYGILVKDFAPIARRVALASARLTLVPEVVREAKERLSRPPRLWTEMSLEDLGGTVEFLDSVPDLAKKGGAQDVTDLERSAAVAKKALEEYRRFLQKDVLPRSDGAWAVGTEAYEYFLHHGLLVSMDASALLEIGRREFDATIRMLEEVARSIDPAKSWSRILEEMKKDYPKAGEVLDVYRRETAKARSFMIDRDVVGIPAWERLEIVDTPPFERSSTPTAAYHGPGPLDTSRVGHFYVTAPTPGAPSDQVERELAAHNLYDIPGTVWHEAYPGHHLQFVYAKEVGSLVRRLNDSPLLTEGWGFYCEELAHELGYYTNPKERLMQLNWRLLRAARILLDVSIHTGKMTYDEAVTFLVEKVGLNREQAMPSVGAFTREPTYYTSYMLGMLEIVRMREKFRRALGSRFTLREFHERVLRFGNVPPKIIEEELERVWR